MRDVPSTLAKIAAPLLSSASFRRLEDVSFLGILSPRFSYLPDHPLAPKLWKDRKTQDDGSRAHHSLGVACLMLRFCEAFQLQPVAAGYAVGWALTHDIATWPLSHTGEVGFAAIAGIDHRALRHKMVTGDVSLPSELNLLLPLRQMGVEPDLLVQMFRTKAEALPQELRALHLVIHSAITPDTLEGIHRSGRAIGIHVPTPSAVLDAIDASTPDMFNTIVRRNRSVPILKFWRAKAMVYEQYINSDAAIEFESRWAHAIAAAFRSVSLSESLSLKESIVIDRVVEIGVPPFEAVMRYKPPQKYTLAQSLKHQRMLRNDRPIESLRSLLVHNEK